MMGGRRAMRQPWRTVHDESETGAAPVPSPNEPCCSGIQKLEQQCDLAS
jgi:hypothetical protein